MWKKINYFHSERGFLLIDILLAFGCLLIMITFLLPIVHHVVNHEQSMRQALVAEEHLSRLVVESIGHPNQTKDVIIETYPFIWTTEKLSNKQFGCLTWIDQRNQQERMCLYVPLYEE